MNRTHGRHGAPAHGGTSSSYAELQDHSMPAYMGPNNLGPSGSGQEIVHRAADSWDTWSIMLTTSEYAELAARSPHGTHARYNAHLLADEEPCDRCRAAETAYRRELRARHEANGTQTERPAFTRTNGYRVKDEEPDEDGERDQDQDQDERPWVGDLEDAEPEDEELELDAAPPTGSHAASLVQTWEMIGKLGGFRLGIKSAPRSRVNASSANGGRTPSANRPRTDPGSRLRAITTELDTRKPRGPGAVRLLAEAASCLTGGVAALHQYGEARGCTFEDIAAAERAVVGKARA